MGLGHIMTLANSIIGVSVLAMPFCFKQCGIILSILVLLLSSIMTRLACHFLLKAAAAARRRNYEFLAFHAFGPKGKLMVELCIIGFLFGTCIAFFVVMGDLGPAIISEVLGINKSPSIRSSVLIGLALLVVLPLGLLRNVDSLSSLCTATILFYFFLVLKIVGEATTHLLAGDWLQYVNLWRPAGILQCIPIFAMALSCQTQVFEIYETLPDPSPSKMNEVVRAAVNICTGVYVCMGFFGYVAVCRPPSSTVISDVVLAPSPTLTGNILMSFPSSFAMQAIKLFFVASVACSFPLVIFPCRASLHSLLFRRAPHHETGMGVSGGGGTSASTASLLPPGGSGGQVIERIPERRFRLLTISLVAGSLAVAFALPDIELVLGLVGSSIGTITCLLLPALCFLKVAPLHPHRHTHWGGDKGVTAERLLAQVMIVVGAVILILSTYANLHAVDQARAEEPITPHPLHIPKIPAVLPPGQLAVVETNVIIPVVLPKAVQGIEVPKKVGNLDSPADTVKKLAGNDKKDGESVKVVPAENVPKESKQEKRQEPPIPVAPDHSTKKKTPSGAEEAPSKVIENEVEAPKQAPGPLVDGMGKEGGAIGGKGVAPAAPLLDMAKEAAEVPDSVHGDAIKKEEEEVGIEEGAAKGEEERRRREEEAEEQRKRAEKERREKELLQKLADDRKKQQEQINIQMEILKKLQALEVKKSEPEKKTDAESKVKENVVGGDEPKKVDGSNLAPVVSAEVKKGDKGEKNGAKEGRVADKGPGIEGEGAPWKSNGIPEPSILKAKEQKKTDQAKSQALDVSLSELHGKKKDPLAEKTSAKEGGGRAALASNMDPLSAKEERKVVSTNFSGISQMKAAVPMPLLLVAQSNGILGRNELKAKEREKREVSLETVEKAVSQDSVIESVMKECEGDCSKNVKESSKVSDTVVMERDKGYSNSQGEWASSLNAGVVRTKDLHRTQEGKQGSDVGNEKVSDDESVPTKAGAAVDKVKELKGGIAICRDEVVSTRSPLLCTLGAKESDNYLSPTIKAPLRLSDPVEGKTAPENIETKVNVDGVMMEVMPLKRDLKYIQEVFEDSSDKAEAAAVTYSGRQAL